MPETAGFTLASPKDMSRWIAPSGELAGYLQEQRFQGFMAAGAKGVMSWLPG